MSSTPPQLAAGTRLLTKDGRKIGNAVVRKYDEASQTYEIETDFGNVSKLSLADLSHLFYHPSMEDEGETPDLARWVRDRDDLIEAAKRSALDDQPGA